MNDKIIMNNKKKHKSYEPLPATSPQILILQERQKYVLTLYFQTFIDIFFIFIFKLGFFNFSLLFNGSKSLKNFVTTVICAKRYIHHFFILLQL